MIEGKDLHHPAILVCGDSMLDEYWFGDVTRISPEAPVPCVKVLREETRPGAAANVAENCKAMGADVITAIVQGARKIRLVARNQQVVRADFDAVECSVKDLVSVRLAVGAAFRRGVKMAILSDYGRGVRAEFQEAIRRAKEVGATVLVDPKGHDYSIYAGADLIKPNTDELRNLVGGWGDVNQMNRKAEALRVQAGVGAILLTRASEGMVLYDATGAYFIKSAAREVYDVTGAGDTAIAAFAVAVSRGYSFPDAAWYANKAAGIVCGKFGTAVATEMEVFGDGPSEAH